MPTTTNKQRLFNLLFSTVLKARAAEEESRPVLEQFLYAVCREGVTREQADRAFRALRERFFDWNEVRVSSMREIAEAMQGLPDAENKAQRIIDFLQEIFETTFSFDLESLHKKGLKQAAKQLSRNQAANDYAVAWVIQQSLGGHAIPLDTPGLRVLHRLGLIDGDEQDMEVLRASLEHHVAKAKGAQFVDLLSDVADLCCWDGLPNCPACPLNQACPSAGNFAQETQAVGAGADFAGRAKPR